jgi:hypothetical protein
MRSGAGSIQGTTATGIISTGLPPEDRYLFVMPGRCFCPVSLVILAFPFHWIAVVDAIHKETLNGTRTFLSQHIPSVALSSSRRLALQHEQAE